MSCYSTYIQLWRARVAQWVRSLDLTSHTSLSPIRRGFAPSFVNYKKGCTRLASDKIYMLLAQSQCFSKTDLHAIAEILLKVALNTKKIEIQIMGEHLMITERSGLYSRENYLFDFSIDICFNSHFWNSWKRLDIFVKV